MTEKLQHHDFDSVFRLMEESFPQDEYRPYAEQAALLQNPAYKIYVQRDEDGRVAAFAAVWEFERFSFLEHFAVAPERRNCGLGAKILRELVNRLPGKLCLEVELPENTLAARRIAFYERNGFFFNRYPYMQPPISAGKAPVPLRIMTWGGFVSETEFAEIQKTLYTRVYGCG